MYIYSVIDCKSIHNLWKHQTKSIPTAFFIKKVTPNRKNVFLCEMNTATFDAVSFACSGVMGGLVG